jgi:hypothetical protein
MQANNLHFEQLTHATGNLELRGQSYAVDCYPDRDRSWGERRPESHASSPAYTWVTGAFGEDFAFNFGSHYNPARDPDWLGLFEPPERIFKDGWVPVKGEQRRIVKSSKITRRELPLCRSLEHEYQFEDSEGETTQSLARSSAKPTGAPGPMRWSTLDLLSGNGMAKVAGEKVRKWSGMILSGE